MVFRACFEVLPSSQHTFFACVTYSHTKKNSRYLFTNCVRDSNSINNLNDESIEDLIRRYIMDVKKELSSCLRRFSSTKITVGHFEHIRWSSR